MFTNQELIRIFYACLADTQHRRDSAHANMMEGEIGSNQSIMRKIRETGLIKYSIQDTEGELS